MLRFSDAKTSTWEIGRKWLELKPSGTPASLAYGGTLKIEMSQAPEVFELAIAVDPSDIDQMGHVNNVVYLRWVQEAATAHWTATASPEDQANLLWVVLRHEIDYLRPARLGDTITARTWVGPASRIKFERHVELRRASDGVVLAQARSVWCPIDSQTMKPVAVRQEVRERFSIAE